MKFYFGHLALKSEQLIVVCTGGRDVASLAGPLPPNIRVASYLPYDKLLPLTDVMVTNGGYGGVHFALRYGAPLVVAGTTEDKVEVSVQVASARVGINLKTDTPTPAAVAAQSNFACVMVVASGLPNSSATRSTSAARLAGPRSA
jgi:UDP:flavonoid glycosyltransferase YjiC (YdhE family)